MNPPTPHLDVSPRRPSPAAAWTDHSLSVPYNRAALMTPGVDENYIPSEWTPTIAACLCAEGPRANTVGIPTAAEAAEGSG